MNAVAWWIVTGVVAWLVVALVVALVVGQVIRRRDRGGPDR